MVLERSYPQEFAWETDASECGLLGTPQGSGTSLPLRRLARNHRARPNWALGRRIHEMRLVLAPQRRCLLPRLSHERRVLRPIVLQRIEVDFDVGKRAFEGGFCQSDRSRQI